MPVQSNNDWDPLQEIIIGTADNCVHPTMNKSTHSFIYGGEEAEDIKQFDGQPIAQWIVDEANEDLEQRTGVQIVRIEIGKVDLLRDTAVIKVHFDGDRQPGHFESQGGS